MKKIITMLALALFTFTAVQAQSLKEATEAFNMGAQALESGDYTSAINSFKLALNIATNLEDGNDVVANCKNAIPQTELKQAKSLLKEKKYDEAVNALGLAADDATKYSVEGIAEEAKDLIPKAFLQKANDAFSAKQGSAAIEAAKQCLVFDPDNAQAYMIIGKVYGSVGKVADAEENYLLAAKNGKQKEAYKQLSTLYVKQAQASLKAGNYTDVLAQAKQSNKYLENANAYRFSASASQKLGKTQDMIEYYKKYLALSPKAKDAAGVNFTIAAAYQQLGDKANALAYYQKVTSDPTYGPKAQEQIAALSK